MNKLSRHQVLVFVVGVAIVASGALWMSSTHTAENAAAKAVKPALAVSLTQVQSSEWPQQLTANGDIAAWQEAVIGAEAGGLRLDEVLVNVGDHVRKGQLLARLQSDTLNADLAQTRASLQEAEASLAEAVANADRARRLQETGALSAQQINQLLTGEKTAQARVTVLKAKLGADEVRVAQTRIVAPDDGSISARQATVGAVVQPGQELFRLIRRDRLEWRAVVAANDLARLKPGMKATIFVGSGTPVAGSVRMLAPTVDAQTRNGLVYVDMDASQEAKAGMFARGEFEFDRKMALILPQSAVQMRDGFSYVYRVGADNKIAETKVKVGRRIADRIEIVEGLTAGQLVVAAGVGFLADGDTVRVVTAPTAEKSTGGKNPAGKAE